MLSKAPETEVSSPDAVKVTQGMQSVYTRYYQEGDFCIC